MNDDRDGRADGIAGSVVVEFALMALPMLMLAASACFPFVSG
jgi:hypothetical protein